MTEFRHSSGIDQIPDGIKREILLLAEQAVFDTLTNEQKADVFNTLDLESSVDVQIATVSPLSTIRLMAKCLEIARPHMPELARPSIKAMEDFFFSMVKTAMEQVQSGACPDCGGPMSDDGRTIN